MIAGAARAFRAEAVRSGGSGALWWVILPLAVALPAAITLAIAAVAERLNHTGGLLSVQAVETTNSLYWVIHLGVTVFVAGAAFAQSSLAYDPTSELHRHLFPSVIPDMLGRWAWWAIVGAAAMLSTAVILLFALPALFPSVYGQVELASPAGWQLVWTLPAWTALAVGMGMGVGALIPSPGAAVGAVTVWSLLVENAVALLPGGARWMGWMPFLNGIYATGQDIAVYPPWGPHGALGYCTAVCAALLAVGCAAQARRNCR